MDYSQLFEQSPDSYTYPQNALTSSQSSSIDQLPIPSIIRTPSSDRSRGMSFNAERAYSSRGDDMERLSASQMSYDNAPGRNVSTSPISSLHDQSASHGGSSLGSHEPDRVDVCPKCSRNTLQVVASAYGERLPQEDPMDVLGATPEYFQSFYGRKCTWTLLKWACPCSQGRRWWWSFLFHSQTIDGKKLNMQGGNPPPMTGISSLQQLMQPNGQHTLRFQRPDQGAGELLPSQMETEFSDSTSFAFPAHTFLNNQSAFASNTASEGAQGNVMHHSLFNPNGARPMRGSSVSSMSTSTTLSTTSPQASDASATFIPSDMTLPSEFRSRRSGQRREIKDPWKYKFLHKYGACESCRTKRIQCDPQHLDEKILRKVPLETWLERPWPEWRPHWVPQASPSDDSSSQY